MVHRPRQSPPLKVCLNAAGMFRSKHLMLFGAAGLESGRKEVQALKSQQASGAKPARTQVAPEAHVA